MTGDQPHSAAGFRIRTLNPAMSQLLTQAGKIARTPYPVLIQGETGTGKELIARGIHEASGRSGAFAAINCGAIPENLFEAELFGAKRGAYTGLESDRTGLFKVADRGTLFLDEIAEMSLSLQAKLLRVLQDGEVRPLGSTKTHRVRARIVAATHHDLERMVQSGSFRMDLYFRISATLIQIPPLRERPEDIPHLLEEAVNEAARVQGVTPAPIDPEVIDFARGYQWPGNVRELLHSVAKAVMAADGRSLSATDFHLFRGLASHPEGSQTSALHELPFNEAQNRFERDYLTNLLARTEGNLSHAAKLAGLPRSTLRDKLRRSGIIARGSSSGSGRGQSRPPSSD